MTSVLWLRRDLRLHDLPALRAAHEDGPIVPLFVVDPTLVASAGARLDALRDALAGAQEEYDGRITVRVGDPAQVVPAVVTEAGASSVHVSGESTPYGRRRGERVHAALGHVPMIATGTPYAVSPGKLLTGGGTPYRVFTPYSKAWRDRGWPRPEPAPAAVRLRSLPSDDDHPLAGGTVADWRRRWQEFLDDLPRYGADRDRPDLDGTSRMSEPLKYGRLHPRTLLADVAQHPAGQTAHAARFVTELAWREFYADVLWHNPLSAWTDLTDSLHTMEYNEPGESFDAWREGRTGYPIVDAGMRQLAHEGWMHNRVRMITASFFTKDLHLWWPHGARVFLDLLRDGDIASNNHGWQWVAGTGTDAAPYFRIFNPVTQGERFDPDGAYVRRYVPELTHLHDKAAHQPWKSPEGYRRGYPQRLVDHDDERRVALARYERARTR